MAVYLQGQETPSTPSFDTVNTPTSKDQQQQQQQQQNIQPVRFKTFLRNTVYEVMRERGWKEIEEGNENEWNLYWADVHWIHEFFDHTHFADHQKLNHFRNHYELTRKDLLVKNMKRMTKYVEKTYGKEEAAKYPSYIKFKLNIEFIRILNHLNKEHAMFQEEFKRNPGFLWIMKPVGKAQGKGIFLINKMSQISQWRKDSRYIRGEKSENQEAPELYIVQRYIQNPYLIGGKKFDIRIYVLVTSYVPLVIYLHRNGFCRISNHQYSTHIKDISNLYIHTTNVAIQKTSPNYDGDKGCKWLLRNLKVYLAAKHGWNVANQVFTEIETLVVRSLMSVQKVMINDKHCFEMYGYDVLLDENLKLWLLEVNASPSLSAETQMDYDLKYGLLNDCFDVIDVEKRFADKKTPTKVGGFDLIYNDGPVKHEFTSEYSSYLGCYHPILATTKKLKGIKNTKKSESS